MIDTQKIRCIAISCLIFFFLLAGCGQHEDKKTGPQTDTEDAATAPVKIEWENNEAVAVLVPQHFLTDVPADSIDKWLTVHMTVGLNVPAILGETVFRPGEGALFRPLIPFTRGLKYEVRLKAEPLAQIEIPVLADSTSKPMVLEIYPTQDSLPENLLKFYIKFSKPMQQGRALEYITLLKDKRDREPAVFLDLQPELWNKEGNILTIWLDPGRIKRGLQPNEKMGPPLKPRTQYQLSIAQGWPDKNGQPLGTNHLVNFVTTGRDSISPDPQKWTIEIPKPGSSQPVEVLFHESIDYMLILNAIHITDDKGADIAGTINVNAEEKGMTWTPSSPWKAGNYILEIESRLEDNAGNNLNHPFDNDLAQKQTEQKDVVKKTFRIQ